VDILRLLNQTTFWQAISSTNDRDDPTYATSVPLPCRKVRRLKNLIGKDGEATTATNQITLPPTSTVAVGDLLDGREVVAISDMVDFTGISVGLQALTR